MISTEPQVDPKGQYSVMQSARILECDQRTLWKYARYFSQLPTLNKVNKRSYFNGKQLLHIWRCCF